MRERERGIIILKGFSQETTDEEEKTVKVCGRCGQGEKDGQGEVRSVDRSRGRGRKRRPELGIGKDGVKEIRTRNGEKKRK